MFKDWLVIRYIKKIYIFVASCNLEVLLKWFGFVIRVMFLVLKCVLIFIVVFLVVFMGCGLGWYMDFNKRSVFVGRWIKW